MNSAESKTVAPETVNATSTEGESVMNAVVESVNSTERGSIMNTTAETTSATDVASNESLGEIKMMKVSDFIFSEKFDNLFGENTIVESHLVKDMTENGYDNACPIVATIWDGVLVPVDGHTRLKASKRAGIDTIPVVIKDFKNETEVRAYMAKTQCNKRKLNDYHIFNYVLRTIDEIGLKTEEGTYNQRIVKHLGITYSSAYQAIKLAEHYSNNPECSISAEVKTFITTIFSKSKADEAIEKLVEEAIISGKETDVKKAVIHGENKRFISKFYNKIREAKANKKKTITDTKKITEYKPDFLIEKVLEKKGKATFKEILTKDSDIVNQILKVMDNHPLYEATLVLKPKEAKAK